MLAICRYYSSSLCLVKVPERSLSLVIYHQKGSSIDKVHGRYESFDFAETNTEVKA